MANCKKDLENLDNQNLDLENLEVENSKVENLKAEKLDIEQNKVEKFEHNPEMYVRTEMLVGADNMAKIKAAKVCVCGLGGVGSAVVEALVRAGVGSLRLVDFDTISASNLNRQLHTTLANIGEPKAAALAARIALINPACEVEVVFEKITAENVAEILSGVDYLVDAIDDVPAKIALIKMAKEQNLPLVVSLGTGNKIYPEMLEISDIAKTEVCPLARKIRYELKRLRITKVPVVYSKEIPNRVDTTSNTPASISFVPPVAGMILAGKVVRDICGIG